MIASILAMSMSLTPVQEAREQAWISSWGTIRSEFTTPQGPVTVYLPQDMRAGDKVSGSIIGARGICVEANSTCCDCDAGTITFDVPRGAASVPILLKDKDGNTVGRIVAPVRNGDRTVDTYKASPIVQEGAAMYVNGPFDGDRRNTSVQIDGKTAGVIAETPRNIVISAPAGELGPHKVEVLEAGRYYTSQVNLVGIKVIAPKKLKRGGTGDLTLEVTGLGNMSENSFPLEIEVASLDPNIAFVKAASDSPYKMSINAAEVRGGTWTHKAPIKGKKVGEYRLSGFVYAPGFPYSSGY